MADSLADLLGDLMPAYLVASTVVKKAAYLVASTVAKMVDN